jgi:fumarylpyruvate hydrolase
MGAIRQGGVAADATLRLRVNGELRQESVLSKMIWSVEEIVARLREDMGLGAGDLIFTGTPAGVGAVGPGDVLEAEVSGLPGLRVGYQ